MSTNSIASRQYEKISIYWKCIKRISRQRDVHSVPFPLLLLFYSLQFQRLFSILRASSPREAWQYCRLRLSVLPFCLLSRLMDDTCRRMKTDFIEYFPGVNYFGTSSLHYYIYNTASSISGHCSEAPQLIIIIMEIVDWPNKEKFEYSKIRPPPQQM